ncbi:hypothetical protein [Lysobacter capsici]|uniref:hypothetical protein n=1 Tax=Lysobacter capsici TaxID=435897 RepID=UPI001C0056B4|nr:hypothetical protein [Lysobacter capsici]QWF17022.1 hypothetical protein KME82_25385 [Lysobacter capsici]
MQRISRINVVIAAALMAACSPADRSTAAHPPAAARPPAAVQAPTTGNPLRDELSMLTGPGARECGLVALGQDPAAAWQCARAADSQRTPYWFAIERNGIDSEIWVAALRTPNGQRYMLHYDSNYMGGPGLLPRFTRNACTGFTTLVADSPENIECSYQ